MSNLTKFIRIICLLMVLALVACDDPNKSESTKSESIYTVNFEANGGIPAPNNQVVSRGGKVEEPKIMTLNGHGFGGWYKEASYIKKWDFAIDTVTSNITLFAKWDINYHTVDFEANGGIPVPSRQNIAYGSNVVTIPVMVREGYSFAGWYKETDFINEWIFSSNVITENITLYAKWLENFTVDFEANGGSTVPQQQIIAYGGKVITPSAITKDGYSFKGWFKEATFVNEWDFTIDIVIDNIILYAKWDLPTLVTGTNFSMKMRWLELNAQSGEAYIIEFDADESIGSTEISFSDKNNISITLKGIGSNRVISLNPGGTMFTVSSGVNLILDSNIELRGRNYNSSLITVNADGKLILNNGAKISDNDNALSSSSNYGGCVYVAGTLIMNGGEISDNTNSRSNIYYSVNSYGGGVYVASNGTFIMNNGIISGNISSTSQTSSGSNYGNSLSYGGGVYVEGTFIMNGGEITGNISSSKTIVSTNNSGSNSSCSSYGGGVYVASNGTFTMNNGKISDNTSTTSFYTNTTTTTNSFVYGAGVYVDRNGSFIMVDGEISDNNYGGGVYVNTNGSFTMYNGEISGHIRSSGVTFGGVFIAGAFIMNGGEISCNTGYYGGGVQVDPNGSFTMNNGIISGNTSSSYGGGVYINRSIFNKLGGTIFGYFEGDIDSNVVKNSYEIVEQNRGHTVHVNHGNSVYIMGKDTTSGPTDNLSFNGTVNPPAWTGEWDY